MERNIYFSIIEAITILFMVIPMKLCEDQSDKNSAKKAAKILTELLTIDLPPKGDPFPKINGPKPHEHVCIVGAGPAGIHMAVSLKEKGYPNIKIFEKTGRVGGKSYDTQLGGFYRFQGTIFLSADYFDNIIKLAKRYNVGEYYKLPGGGVCKHTVCSR